jgi:hypothetical protein
MPVIVAHLTDVSDQTVFTFNQLAACGQESDQLIEGHAVRGARAETRVWPEAALHFLGESRSSQGWIGVVEQAEDFVAMDLFGAEHGPILPKLIAAGRSPR